ncbi:MAG: hypothetical protein RMJ66_03450 [Bacteroidia bacterium]|nr:hypothetical protein [Bacteroidia bacterium]MDW8134102.1 hypothetical protein [Bacteroidia bacterium]
MLRRWHFLLADQLTSDKKEIFQRHLEEALKDWHTHGRPLSWKVEFPYSQYIQLICYGNPSGCAIDKLHRAVNESALACHLSILSTEWVGIICFDFIITKKFYEIIKIWQEGNWDPSWRIIEVSEEGLREVRLEESYLSVHLCG